jgi:hypothetical protein
MDYQGKGKEHLYFVWGALLTETFALLLAFLRVDAAPFFFLPGSRTKSQLTFMTILR